MNFFISIFNKRFSKKRFTNLIVSISSIIFMLVVLMNYLVDPIGIYREKLQFQDIQNKAFPKLISYKIYSDYDYAIVGTSRSQVIDHLYTNKYNISSKNLSLAGSSIDINYEITKEVKKQNKNVILFLDPYTLSETYNKIDPKKIGKLRIIEEEISKISKNQYYLDFQYLTLGRTTLFSLKTIVNNLRDKDRDFKYQKKNKKENYKIINTEAMFKNHPIFSDYNIDYNLVYKTVDLLSKKDFIVITPVVFEYYYQLYNIGALNKYFDLIEDILKKSEVNIVSFLYFNDDLLDGRLFDNTGSHFKHFYGKKIIADIFSKEKKISILLNRENFGKYKKDIINWLKIKKEEFQIKVNNE